MKSHMDTQPKSHNADCTFAPTIILLSLCFRTITLTIPLQTFELIGLDQVELRTVGISVVVMKHTARTLVLEIVGTAAIGVD